MLVLLVLLLALLLLLVPRPTGLTEACSALWTYSRVSCTHAADGHPSDLAKLAELSWPSWACWRC